MHIASSFLATRRLGVFSKIAIPSIVGSATTTITSAVSTALISFNLGTENYVAYSMVYVAFGFVDSLHGGIPGAKDILVSQAIGAGNILGGGQYEQAAFLMAHAFAIPLYAVVWLLFPDFIALLGLEPEIARTFLSRLNPLRFHSINSLAQTLFLCLSLVSCCYRTRPTIFALAYLPPDVFRHQ